MHRRRIPNYEERPDGGGPCQICAPDDDEDTVSVCSHLTLSKRCQTRSPAVAREIEPSNKPQSESSFHPKVERSIAIDASILSHLQKRQLHIHVSPQISIIKDPSYC